MVNKILKKKCNKSWQKVQNIKAIYESEVAELKK